MKARLTVEFDVNMAELDRWRKRLGREGIHPETYLAMRTGAVHSCEFVTIGNAVETQPRWLGHNDD